MYYARHMNATKAYQKAFECGYDTANANGSRLLVKASVKKAILDLKKQRVENELLHKNEVLKKYIDIAFADIGDFVKRGDSGFSFSIKPLEEMDTSIISELSNTENGVKLKLADKMKALDFLAEYPD
ncbi:terminase small subunit [Viridibacillus sp. NPDC093762]|uniref:terminase small subunit n=1 Tax=Viridibacillus sp. NPDC093762 TaxID=3390720 RepID=UPI003D01C204